MRRLLLIVLARAIGCALMFCSGAFAQQIPSQPQQQHPPPAYLGFDANAFPGSDALPALRRTFSFAGYWLNNPPGANSNSWLGKRPDLLQLGFGFLVLFNGRLERELKSIAHASSLGSADATVAADAASGEGFRPGTIIFLDQEEGGRMESDQMAYIVAWIDGVIAADYRPGIYCSGMVASEGKNQFIITANDVRTRLGPRNVAYFVYNDACPPAPGCRSGAPAPQPSASGLDFASIWQFAQSPRRKPFTASCASTYNRDGNCYAPGDAAPAALLDLDSANSPDPSNGGRQIRRRTVKRDVAKNE